MQERVIEKTLESRQGIKNHKRKGWCDKSSSCTNIQWEKWKRNHQQTASEIASMQITPERDDDDWPPPDTNDVEIEESKSIIDLDSAEGNLGENNAGGRFKTQQIAAIDGDMKQRLLHHEEDGEFDDFKRGQ